MVSMDCSCDCGIGFLWPAVISALGLALPAVIPDVTKCVGIYPSYSYFLVASPSFSVLNILTEKLDIRIFRPFYSHKDNTFSFTNLEISYQNLMILAALY